MTKVIVLLALVFSPLAARAQLPWLSFQNGATSLVTYAATGQPLRTSNGVVITLYGAPDGTTDESAFVLLSTNATIGALAGRFNGGFVYVPFLTCDSYGLFQYRAYERAYGNSYEAAAAALPINGRRALIGKSSIGRIFAQCNPHPPVSTAQYISGVSVDYALGPAFFTAADIVAAEGSNGVATATFNVQLVGDTNEARSVDFNTADGSALAGSDYVSTNGTLLFEPGETSKVVVVTLTPDAPPESDEDFFLQLSNPVNVEIGRAQASCIITELRVLGLRVDTVVTFNTISGRHYAVEKSLDTVNWTLVTDAENVTGTGATASIVDAGSGCSSLMLYRVRLLQ